MIMEAKKPQNLQSLSWRPRRPVVRLIQSIHYQNFTGKETKTWKACCCCSVAKSCSTLCDPWTEACQASLSFTQRKGSQSLLKLMSIESVMPSNHLILCHPLLFLPAIFPIIKVFSNESALHIRWPKYWSFSFSISPSNEYSGLISFRTDRFDLLALQGTLKSLLQHHNWKVSILQCLASYII